MSSRWDLPLLALGGGALLATLFSPVRHARAAPLTPAVLVFLGVMALSILLSRDAAASLRLSAPLLPAALLFFLIADRFDTLRHVSSLYLTFSLLSLCLSLWLLWNAWLDGWVSPNVWALHAGTPLLVVGNDVTFLAIVTPLSLALIYGGERRAVGVIAGLSIVLSICVIGLFLSRGALLAMTVSLACAGLLIRPRAAVAGGTALLIVAAVVDASLGFPLANKFGDIWTQGLPRTDLWRAAWARFLEAPWIGHGPYTVVYTAADQGESMRWAHNWYLDVLVGQGVIGLGGLMLLLGAAVSRARITHRTSTGEARVLHAGALGAFAGFCVAGVYEISFLRLWAVITLFALLGVIARLAVPSSSACAVSESR